MNKRKMGTSNQDKSRLNFDQIKIYFIILLKRYFWIKIEIKKKSNFQEYIQLNTTDLYR